MGEVARLIAASLSDLTGLRVEVSAVWPHDPAGDTAEASAFLDVPLTAPVEFARVAFTVDTVEWSLVADPSLPRCALARQLALDLADQVHEAGHGTPFPPCPNHSHPLTLSRPGRTLDWVCPERPRVPIATLLDC